MKAATAKDHRTDWYVSLFEDFERSLNGQAGSDIHAIRMAAILKLVELGFPTTRDEEWKYTDISALASVPFKPVFPGRQAAVGQSDIDRLMFGTQRWTRLVCVNGHVSKELSSVASPAHGVRVESLETALAVDSPLVRQHLAQHARYDENAFTALSTAFLMDGAFVHVPACAVAQEPIHLMFLSTDHDAEFVAHPRNLIIAGDNSQVSILETYIGLGRNSYFTNAVTEIVLGENAVVEHEKIQLETDRAFHVATIHVHQERNSSFISNSVSVGGKIVRNNITSVLAGDGTEATLNGLYLGAGDQLVDNHTVIDHASPHSASHELYKGILDGKSRGVFNGKIIVRKNAQKTDAKQTNKNLVLSDEATIDTKPQLEIFANDVRCTHGATIGQLDEDAMFYLRSRGIPMEMAREMLIYAFASDVIDRVKFVAIREELQRILQQRLGRSRGVGSG